MEPIFYTFDQTNKMVPVSKFVEYTEYVVTVEADSVRFLGSDLRRYKGIQHSWSFTTPFAVGRSASLCWTVGKEKHKKDLVIQPHEDKIEERDIWQKMLESLLEWSESLLGHQGVRDGSVDFGELSHYLMLEALYPLMESFIQSLEHLFENLRERTITPDTPLNLIELRAPFPLQQIATHPTAMAWIRGEYHNGGIPIIEAPFVTQTFDHPVNRYVRWIIEQVMSRLEEASKRLLDFKDDTDSTENVWRKERAEVLSNQKVLLQQLLWSSPLYDLRSSPLEDAAFLVILNDPLYAKVHHYGRLLQSQSLSTQDNQFAASMSRSFDIYELWCFREVVRQFEAALNVKPTYHRTKKKDKNKNPRWGTKAVFSWEEGIITIEYNATFSSRFSEKYRSLPLHEEPPRRYSVLSKQRPDVVVYYDDSKNNRKVWLALDAKYRTSESNLSKAFSSAFSYRQSLVDPNYGGSPLGCYLLVPKILPQTQKWFGTEFSRYYHFGAFECRPDATTPNEIVTFLLDQLQLQKGDS